ncbi:hypothetical protein ACLKA7_005883 [Drosophila subpalustris]
MAKQDTWLTSLLMLLVCTSTTSRLGLGLGLVRADDQEEESMGMTLSEVVDFLQPLGDNCDASPTKEQVEEMVLNKEEASLESKCFRRCVLSQFDLMPEKKKLYDENKTIEMMNMMYPELEKESRGIFAKCNQNGALTDECEIAHSISMCMLKEMRAANYKIPNIKE